MTTVIEYSLHARPDEWATVRDSYAAFVDGIEHSTLNARLILIAGEPDSGLVRGIGVYDSAEQGHAMPQMEFFRTFTAEVTPHLASDPERMEFTLEHLYIHEDMPTLQLGDATVVEASFPVDPTNLGQFWERYRPLVDGWIFDVPSTRMIVLTSHPSGLVRTFLVYDRRDVADAAPGYGRLHDFVEWVGPLLASPATRSEHQLMHLFHPGH